MYFGLNIFCPIAPMSRMAYLRVFPFFRCDCICRAWRLSVVSWTVLSLTCVWFTRSECQLVSTSHCGGNVSEHSSPVVPWVMWECVKDVRFNQSGSDWPQMRQIEDFFISELRIFWFLNYLKKSRICLILGQSDPLLDQIWHPWMYIDWKDIGRGYNLA